MARKFNGTSDVANVVVNLSGQTRVTVSAWLYRTASPANRIIFEYDANNGFDVIANQTGLNDMIRGYMGGLTWQDRYPAPSLNAWHHYLWIVNTGTFGNFNRVFVDGVEQVLTAAGHTSAAGTFANSTLTIGGRAATLFMDMTIAEFTLWNGQASSSLVSAPTDTAKGLYSGWTGQHLFGVPTLYIPMLGDSPEPNYTGGQVSAALTGTTVATGPPARTLLMPGAA